MTNKAQVMSVHGAWADGSCWSKVILPREAKGITVTAAQIPLTSHSEDIAVTKRLLSANKDPTVMKQAFRTLSMGASGQVRGARPLLKRLKEFACIRR